MYVVIFASSKPTSMFFQSRSSTFTETNRFLQRLLTLTITKFRVSTKTAVLLVTIVGFVEPSKESEELTPREPTGVMYSFNENGNGEKYVILDNHVSTSRSNCGCRKCGAWSIFKKVSFTLQEPVRQQ